MANLNESKANFEEELLTNITPEEVIRSMPSSISEKFSNLTTRNWQQFVVNNNAVTNSDLSKALLSKFFGERISNLTPGFVNYFSSFVSSKASFSFSSDGRVSPFLVNVNNRTGEMRIIGEKSSLLVYPQSLSYDNISMYSIKDGFDKVDIQKVVDFVDKVGKPPIEYMQIIDCKNNEVFVENGAVDVSIEHSRLATHVGLLTVCANATDKYVNQTTDAEKVVLSRDDKFTAAYDKSSMEDINNSEEFLESKMIELTSNVFVQYEDNSSLPKETIRAIDKYKDEEPVVEEEIEQ